MLEALVEYDSALDEPGLVRKIHAQIDE
jgi:hypothetical protein